MRYGAVLYLGSVRARLKRLRCRAYTAYLVLCVICSIYIYIRLPSCAEWVINRTPSWILVASPGGLFVHNCSKCSARSDGGQVHVRWDDMGLKDDHFSRARNSSRRDGTIARNISTEQPIARIVSYEKNLLLNES